MHPVTLLQALILLILANGAPVAAKRLLGNRFARSLDGGRRFFDGRPVFGSSKTIRGIVLALAITTLSAPLVGLAWTTGLAVGAAAMTGDLLSSFIKRRLGMPAQSMAMGLDQIPESLLPLLAVRQTLGLTMIDIIAGVVLFLVAELLLSRLLYRYGLRDRPY